MELEEITEKIKEKPEVFGDILKSIEDAVGIYKAFEKGLIDAIWFKGPLFKKDKGADFISCYIQIEEGERATELTELKQYWIDNYEGIKKEVYNI